MVSFRKPHGQFQVWCKERAESESGNCRFAHGRFAVFVVCGCSHGHLRALPFHQCILVIKLCHTVHLTSYVFGEVSLGRSSQNLFLLLVAHGMSRCLRV